MSSTRIGQIFLFCFNEKSTDFPVGIKREKKSYFWSFYPQNSKLNHINTHLNWNKSISSYWNEVNVFLWDSYLLRGKGI